MLAGDELTSNIIKGNFKECCLKFQVEKNITTESLKGQRLLDYFVQDIPLLDRLCT